MRLVFMHTGQRRFAKASPHGKLWGIGLRACDYRASSPENWRGSNLLGQALEHVQEILCRETMPQKLDSILPDTTAPMDHSSDTVFEIDPVTRIRLKTAPSTEHTHNAIILAFTDSRSDDYIPEVFLTNTNRPNEPLISEQGPDLISGVVTLDDVTFTTVPSLTSGASATSQFRCRTLLD